MIKGKVRIISWPPVGAENLKPRFKIREEYPVLEVGSGALAILDDHNQVTWMASEMVTFTEAGGEKIPSLDEFLKANPEKSPEAREKAIREEQARVQKQATSTSDGQGRSQEKLIQEQATARAHGAEVKKPEPQKPVNDDSEKKDEPAPTNPE